MSPQPRRKRKVKEEEEPPPPANVERKRKVKKEQPSPPAKVERKQSPPPVKVEQNVKEEEPPPPPPAKVEKKVKEEEPPPPPPPAKAEHKVKAEEETTATSKVKGGGDGAYINIKVNGGRLLTHESFRIKRHSRMQRLFDAYCDKQAIDRNAVAFLCHVAGNNRSRRMRDEKTPDEYGLEDGDVIDALLHQSGS